MRSLACFLLWALFAVGNASAKTYTLDAINCEVTIPDSYHTGASRADFAAEGSDASDPAIFLARAAVARHVDIDSQRLVGPFDDGITHGGGHILAHHYVMDNGYRCLDITFSRQTQTFETTISVERVFVADGYAYSVTIAKVNADPTTDPDLIAARQSFRFLTPGDAPAETTLFYTMLHSADEPGESTGFVWTMNVFLLMFDMLVIGAYLSPAFLLLWAGMVFYYFFNRDRYAVARAAQMAMEPAPAVQPVAPEPPSMPGNPKPPTRPSSTAFQSGAKSDVRLGVTRVPPMRARRPSPPS
jgi:hypothetical protein